MFLNHSSNFTPKRGTGFVLLLIAFKSPIIHKKRITKKPAKLIIHPKIGMIFIADSANAVIAMPKDCLMW